MKAAFTERNWQRRAADGFHKWVNQQSVNWAATEFSCRAVPCKLPKHKKARVGFSASIESLSKGFGLTMRHLDFRYLKNSARKKGARLLRVPYLGGSNDAGVHYHLHCLIEVPSGVPLEEYRDYMRKIFQKKMEEVINDSQYEVETTVWCEPYYGNFNGYEKYAERFEGSDLSAGLEKVVVEHLVMNPG